MCSLSFLDSAGWMKIQQGGVFKAASAVRTVSLASLSGFVSRWSASSHLRTFACCSLCLECPVLWLHILQMSAPRNSLLYIPKPSIIFCPIIHYSLPFCIFRLVTPFLYRFLACEFEGRGCVFLSMICVDRGDWRLQSVGPYRVGHNTMHVSSIPRSEPGSSENT